MWFPQLAHRGARDAWVASGRRSPLDLAREQVEAYQQGNLAPVLDDDRIKDVHQVVVQAEQALLGSTTGVLP